eukprot:625387-Amphidinium_carterae.1
MGEITKHGKRPFFKENSFTLGVFLLPSQQVVPYTSNMTHAHLQFNLGFADAFNEQVNATAAELRTSHPKTQK